MLLLKIMLGVVLNYFFRFFSFFQAMAPPAPIKSSSPPMGAWEGLSGKSMPCATSHEVIEKSVISKVYNLVFIFSPYLIYVTFWVKDCLAVVSFIKYTPDDNPCGSQLYWCFPGVMFSCNNVSTRLPLTS